MKNVADSALEGLRINLQRTKDVPCAECGQSAVVTCKEAHDVTGLRCTSCSRHRGSLPKPLTDFMTATIDLFGRPDEPITVSNSGFAPANETAPLGATAASTSAP